MKPPLSTSYVRQPYHERFTEHGYGQIGSGPYAVDQYTEVPYVPDGLIVADDSAWSESDRDRLYTDTPGCPMNGYVYGSEPREWLLRQEKAALRIASNYPALYESLVAREHIRHSALTTPLLNGGQYFGEQDDMLQLKLENLQYQQSFKVRGAAYAIARLLQTGRPEGIAAATAGNHGQGVARAAALHGLASVLYMPVTTPEVKQSASRSLGATIRLVGQSYSDAAYACETDMRENEGLQEIHPFNNADVITGQGTIGSEILGQNPNVRRVYVGAGGGGAVVGIAKVLKSYDPTIEVVAVQLQGGGAFSESFRTGRLITMAEVDGFSDGTAVKRIGELTLAGALQYVDRVVEVSKEELLAAMTAYHKFSKASLQQAGHLEPAGALGLAGFKQEAALAPMVPTVAVCTGGNIRSQTKQYVEERAVA